MAYKTPGAYIEEISKLPPSVAEVETAIPAFIGYTQKVTYKGTSLTNKPKRIKSYKEFEEVFGMAPETTFTITLVTVDGEDQINGDIADPGLTFRMNYCLEMYFANGGGPCYIVSTGQYGSADFANTDQLLMGLTATRKEDEPTMLLFPDAPRLSESNFYSLYVAALRQSFELKDRIVIVDVFNTGDQDFSAVETSFRGGIGNNYLNYGAAYYPWLKTALNYAMDEGSQAVTGGSFVPGTVLKVPQPDLDVPLTPGEISTSVYHSNNELYHAIKKQLADINIVLAPSCIMAGIYAMVDNTRGVWKSPANVSLTRVKEPTVKIDNDDQESMNVHTTGKSVNAIREFAGKGIMVWGARSLDGNSNEWRYIAVRRFFNMVEESTKKASENFVFEANDANTWVKVRAMIENFLILQWREGALAGATPGEAFYVKVGLGETMSALDILEGRMNVEIGMAVVRPAEFIILKFSHKMQQS